MARFNIGKYQKCIRAGGTKKGCKAAAKRGR
jgi:hypothetical protein